MASPRIVSKYQRLGEIKESHIILVEGNDEVQLLQALLRDRDAVKVLICDCAGRDNIPRCVKAMKVAHGFRENVLSLGVIRDADTDPASAAAAIRAALRNADLPEPTEPLQLAGIQPKVAFYVLPNPDEPGNLEDLCLQSVSSGSAVQCVDAYFDCLARTDNPPTVTSKRRMQVYLASQTPLKQRVGHGIAEEFFPLTGTVFDSLRQFLDVFFA
jgi:hypothetical protein